MPFQPDQDPSTIEWARTPPPPLLEALETLQSLAAAYATTDRSGQVLLSPAAVSAATTAYRNAARILQGALIEEYAP